MNVNYLVDQSDVSRPVRHFNHNAFPIQIKGVSLLDGAINYLAERAERYHLSQDDIRNLAIQLEGKYSTEKPSFRLEAQKEIMETVSLVFVQTCFGLPVWESGIAVYIDKKKNRILSSVSSAYDKLEIEPVRCGI